MSATAPSGPRTVSLAPAERDRFPRCVASADEAIALIREHHGRWRQSPPGPAQPPDGGR
jgi:hypothetical protein